MIYFITSNKHKYEEIKKIVKNVKMLTIPYPEIQANELEEVVVYGIEYLKEKVDGNFFIEDSGLFIKSLNDFPGVYSSFVFKTIGNKGILKLMENKRNREAFFASVIGYYDGKINLFKGICKGKIAREEKGNNGFGYDPIFIPEGKRKTFGEMEIEEKNLYSHRSKAVKKFIDFLKYS
ncbi:MAG: XTP/dITP diphosphatase [Thermoplasmatales archaeon]|nr:XTP/dITP diphosphatase [Thermoplasmatales archaeon]